MSQGITLYLKESRGRVWTWPSTSFGNMMLQTERRHPKYLLLLVFGRSLFFLFFSSFQALLSNVWKLNHFCLFSLKFEIELSFVHPQIGTFILQNIIFWLNAVNQHKVIFLHSYWFLIAYREWMKLITGDTWKKWWEEAEALRDKVAYAAGWEWLLEKESGCLHSCSSICLDR